MPKLQPNTTNFTAGEFSPLLAGRVDIEKYNSSAKELYNVVVLKQGGATIRPPLGLLGEVKDSTKAHRLIRFVFSRTDAYQLEFGDQTFRVQRSDGTLVEVSPGVPYEITSPFASAEIFDVDFTQGDDTMILTHPNNFPKRLRRFAEDHWVFDDAPLNPQPVSEVGDQSSIDSMTLSDGTVGTGRTIIASSAYFLASDLGREISWGGGVALITLVNTNVNVTVTVTLPFADLVGRSAAFSFLGPIWTLLTSPQTTATASAASPVGAAITVTLGTAGWRAETGNLVEINGGLVRVTGVTSTVLVNAVIVRELTSAVAAPAGSWALLRAIWNLARGYPKTCAFYQQRLWFGNIVAYQQSIWGSRTALFFDYTPGTDDDSAVYKTVAVTDEVNPLQFLCGAGSLVMLGYSAEVEGKGGIEKPITQTNMQNNAQSEWGAASIRPMTVGKEILFVERGGKSVRALFPQQVDGYDSTDVSVFSEHLLADGIKEMTFERKPNSVLWVCTNTGELLAFTYNREQNTIAWAGGGTEGVVESLSTIPTADADVTDAIVLRTIDGVQKRYRERLDWGVSAGARLGFYDCRIEQTFGVATATPGGFDALEGCTVAVLGDGVYMGTFEVVGGVITLPGPVLNIVAGLPYTARIVVPAPEVSTGTGTSTGQAVSTNQVKVRLYQSIGMLVNGEEVAFRRFDVPQTLDQGPDLFTGLKKLTQIGWNEDGENDLTLEQPQGLPWTVLSIVRSLTVNAG